MSRYDRHIALQEIGSAGQQRLLNAKVLVIGAGGLGCPVLQYLAAAGVGTIGIVDGDKVSLSNLQRQVLFKESEVGQSKVKVAAKVLRQLNGEVEIIEHPVFVSRENVRELIESYDIIIDGSDNFPTRYLVNDACVIENKPLVFGSIDKFEGQVSVFNYNNGPSYRCLFPNQPDTSANCNTDGVIGILPGIVGTQMAAEGMKIILGIGDVLSGKLKVIDVLKNQENYYKVSRVETNFERKELEVNYDTPKSSLHITWEELQHDLKSKQVSLIDLREAYEFEVDGLEASENIPFGELEKNIEQLFQKEKIVLMCASGQRSEVAAKFLLSKGLTNVFSLKEGLPVQ